MQENLHTTHLLKLLDKMYKYAMDPTRTVEATEWTRDVGRTRDGRTDGRTDRQTDGRSETNIPPNNFVVYNYAKLLNYQRNQLNYGANTIIVDG